jgi:ABC-type nitrate/sulfonate/bicarbonate transport system substrate-binding protein
VTITAYNGDQTALRALAVKEADVAYVGCGTALAAYQVGSPLKIISAFAPASDYQLITQADIQRPKDLEGRNLGVSQTGAVSEIVPQLLIQADGGDVSKVTSVSVGGSSARVQALVAKKIDGGVLNAALVPPTRQYDYLHVIANATTTLPNFLFSCEVARTDTIQAKDQAIQKFETALLQGTRWFYDNADAAKAVSEKLDPDLPKESVDYGVDTYETTHYFSRTGTLAQDAFDFTVKTLITAKILTQPIQIGEMYEPKFVNQANATLGPSK